MWMKLNFDVSKITSRTMSSGVVRDNTSGLVVAYDGSCREGSNNEAKALAPLWGMRIVKARGMNMLAIEGDYLLIISVLNRVGQCSWKIK